VIRVMIAVSFWKCGHFRMGTYLLQIFVTMRAQRFFAGSADRDGQSNTLRRFSTFQAVYEHCFRLLYYIMLLHYLLYQIITQKCCLTIFQTVRRILISKQWYESNRPRALVQQTAQIVNTMMILINKLYTFCTKVYMGNDYVVGKFHRCDIKK